ncbi:tyrosine-type recombinase/integrase [Glycocaulis profundi]|nr:tyrosine-type recombinase/integrase [Glycocaulis profundi]
MSLINRNGTYYLRRRVPRRYSAVESRATVWISLHTDSEAIARQKAGRAWTQIIEAWEAHLAGASEDAAARYAAAQELARIRGFQYLDVGAVASLPTRKLVERIEAAEAPSNAPDAAEAAALLGAPTIPEITVEGALEQYWTLAREKTLGKSRDQLRRWKNPRLKAVRNFVNVVGNKPLSEITRDDMLEFRDHWLDRIQAGEVAPGTANKDFIHLENILKTVNNMKRLNLTLPLGDLAFAQGEQRTRPPFSDGWIRTRLLAPGALDGLNSEARAIVLGMVNTGYRPSEATALKASTIRLDHAVPHLSIEPDGRQLKTAYSRRLIPLCGVSLEAFKAFPEGFSRYEDSATLSGTVNGFLRENGLLETPQHSFYSLRHSFEDRMLAAGIDDRIRRDVFGHKLDRERYGKGASLEHVQTLIQKISF